MYVICMCLLIMLAKILIFSASLININLLSFSAKSASNTMKINDLFLNNLNSKK